MWDFELYSQFAFWKAYPVTMWKVGDKCWETVGGKKDEETSSNETIAEASAGPLSKEGSGNATEKTELRLFGGRIGRALWQVGLWVWLIETWVLL